MDTFADPGRADRAPFAGRERELARLDALSRARADGAGPAVVDVTGEPGIGKTRLLTEFAVRTRGRGATVLHGRAGPAPADGTPFQPFADAFADLDPRDHATAPDLAGLAELVERAAPVRRIATALGRVVAPGLVLVLDDLHGADAASVALVDHLLRHPPGAPFLLVLARRKRQTPPALASALARADDAGTLARLALGPLTPEECAHGPGAGLPPEPARDIHAASGGNPLYYRALALARTPRGEVADPAPVAALLDELAPLGRTERSLVEAMAVLGPRATPELLATVAGEDAGADPRPAPGPAPGGDSGPSVSDLADVTDLADVAGGGGSSSAGEPPGGAPRPSPRPGTGDATRPSPSPSCGALGVASRSSAPREALGAAPSPSVPVGVGAALRELVRRDLVRADHDGHALALRHPALSELLLGTLDPWRRRELHRRAAAALTAVGAPVTERAPHLVRAAAVWNPAIAAQLVEAAERITAADPSRAADWLGAVLDLLPDLPEHHGTRRELTLQRADALGSAGRVAESRDLLHRLIDDDHGEEGAEGAEPRTSAVLLCAFMERHLGRYPEADALLRRELARTPGPRPDLRTRLVVEWGCRALFAARYPEVRHVVAETLDATRRRRDDAGTAEVLTLAALGEVYEGETAAARAHAAEAAALTDSFTDGRLADHPESLVRLGWSEAFLERYGTAERHATRGIAMARRAGRPFALSQLLLCSAYVHLLTGRVGTALDQAEEALAVARALGGAELIGFSRAIRATVLLHARPLGDPEVPAAAEEAAATVGTAEGWWATQARCMLAHTVPLDQDPHRVREVLLRAGGDRDLSRLQPSLRPGYLEVLTGAVLAAGDLPEAERVARRALAEAESLGLPVQRSAARRAWGRVLARRGEPAAAARAFTEAAGDSARSGAVLREAQGLLLAAPQLQASGDAEQAAGAWRGGRRLAAGAGARMLVDLADRTRPAPPRGDGTGGRLAVLTPREREVSALVAEGLTNQAVADRLCLSPRTVESHVARVYRKTGVETRAGLASLVVRDERAAGQSLRG
ncbi:LuxR family transcriptional regulator [Streptomyces sp. TLI_105]|uniref:helix-turn-helix transcriptional regulator n=1 Tax=Streptomyces sp. TLI_105 TaxID=1881019 RepID=UPI00089B070A|nr:LuxR family transcriptional regulator [Streptomyces sp. TLI_105]SED86942.1 regulatory protein, luxR family [Streptomyces sp. TLI_105]